MQVDIIDSGVGIPEDRMKDLFTPKFGGKSSRIKLGLGLATSQRIVHHHRGEIVVDSVEGEGTRVSVRLPMAGVDAQR